MFDLLLAAAFAAVAAPGDEAAIRAARAETNAAIAAHDVGRLTSSFTDDVVLVSGAGEALIGKDAMRTGFIRAFAAPGFVDYVRTPVSVTVSGDGARAAERGRWIGRWRNLAGETRRSGTYLAHWVRPEGRWRIRAELYVTLACDGAGC
jgi:uncharacterized protein (TIGR02246 family)